MSLEFKSKPVKGLDENLQYTEGIRAKQNKMNLEYAYTKEAQDRRKKKNYHEGWRQSRREYLTGRKRPEHSEKMKGRGNSQYGSGNTYIEVTTGFIGQASDMEEKFGVSKGNLATHAKKDRPLKQGKYKGLHFQIYKP